MPTNATRRMRVTKACLLAALFVALAGPAVPARAQESPPALDALHERLLDADGKHERVLTLGRIALVEKPGGELQQEAERLFWEEAPGGHDALLLLFGEVTPADQVRILELFRTRWDVLGRGVSPPRSRMVREGLLSDAPEVRREAARLAATRPFYRTLHSVIDASLEHPELTLAAVLAVGVNRDQQGCRWALETGAAEGGVIRRAALLSIAHVGPECRDRLVPFLDADDPAQRLLAAEGMLYVATEEDAPRLREWSERWSSEHPGMSRRLSDAADQLEEGWYRPEPIESVELTF